MNPTRRAALRLLASTTLISMPAAIVTAAPQALDPDVTLSALYAEWQQFDEAYIAAVEAKEPAEAQYEALEPAHPPTLQVKAFDAFDVDHGFNELPNGSGCWFTIPAASNSSAPFQRRPRRYPTARMRSGCTCPTPAMPASPEQLAQYACFALNEVDLVMRDLQSRGLFETYRLPVVMDQHRSTSPSIEGLSSRAPVMLAAAGLQLPRELNV